MRSRERSGGWLVAAGALTGAALLTKLTMAAFVPALAVACVAFLREGRWRAVLAAAALPAAAVAPWIAFNLHHYGALTGSDRVQELMEPTLNPDRIDYGVGDLAAKHVALLNGVLPDEWWVEFLSSAKRRLRDVFMGLVLAVPLLAAVRIPRRRSPPGARRAAPAARDGVVLMSVSLLAENWDAFYARYLYGALPGFAVFAALAVGRALGARALVLELGRADRPAAAALGSPVDGHAGDGLAALQDHEVAVARLPPVGAAQVVVEDRDPGGLAAAIGLTHRGDRGGPADDERRCACVRGRGRSRAGRARSSRLQAPGCRSGRVRAIRPARRRAGSRS